MKQIFLSLKDGEISLKDIPKPTLLNNTIIIRTQKTLISSGTERMLVDFGKANYLKKAKKQPEKVTQTINKLKTDGLFSVLSSIKNKLDEPIPLGYCNVGIIESIGKNVKGFKVGQRVISNGSHADYVRVNPNLCAIIPEDVSNERAVFTVLASVALNGVRLLKPSFGETIVVSGLGLVGILSLQILKKSGCNAIGIDLDPKKCKLASELGFNVHKLEKSKSCINWINNITNNIGADGFIISTATSSNQPIDLAADASRRRGRIILIGVSGLNINRDLFYKKELSFQVSCSYGPGRYDPIYEKDGIDYPIDFVRWTENRNFQSILNSLRDPEFKVEKLISHKFDFDNINSAYNLLTTGESFLGIEINYKNNKLINEDRTFELFHHEDKTKSQKIKPLISFIGAGNYAATSLLPAFNKAKANLHTIGATTGVGPFKLGNKFRFRYATTDIENIINNKNINTVVIATRHDSHAKYIQQCLLKGKNIFVEKPLCINYSELKQIEEVYSSIDNEKNFNKLKPILMVGFNRRFAPLVIQLKNLLSNMDGPKSFIYTCNTGNIDHDHWIHDPNKGGGRMIAEACHFVDLIKYLASDKIESISRTNLDDNKKLMDTFSLSIKFKSGSIGTVHYFSNGHKSFPKERLEVFCNSSIFCLNNFQTLDAWGVKGFKKKKLFFQDKGQKNCVKAFIKSLENGLNSPISFSEIVEIHSKLFEII